MKFSENWLREWANPALDTEALVEQLSVSGLEVDTADPVVAEPLTGITIGKVVEAIQHPNADRLRLCTVDTGAEETLEIVCGAPNARAGVKFPVATVGTRLPGNIKIKKSKIRGVTSNGMLCSARELGLGEDHDGILELPEDAPVGGDFVEFLALNDFSIDIDLTPNVVTVSASPALREVGVLNRVPVNEPAFNEIPASIDETFPVTLEAPEGCPRYLGRVIRTSIRVQVAAMDDRAFTS